MNPSADQPTSLSELLTRYLQRQQSAHAQGLGFPDSVGEVVPYDAVPVQPVDPQRAWDDAVAVLGHFATSAASTVAVPPHWPTLVASQEPAVDLAFSLGNFPQMVRDLHLVLHGDPAALQLSQGRPLSSVSLEEWACGSQGYPQGLLAAGVLRLARQFDKAAELLRAPAPPEWQALHQNESAALAWHAGRTKEARALWQAQADSVPVRFNRGLAALFLGDPAGARPNLAEAVNALPDSSPWHHLGALYLALAEDRA
jgi:hypothetical protein